MAHPGTSPPPDEGNWSWAIIKKLRSSPDYLLSPLKNLLLLTVVLSWIGGIWKGSCEERVCNYHQYNPTLAIAYGALPYLSKEKDPRGGRRGS
jgi:hypothetical protein